MFLAHLLVIPLVQAIYLFNLKPCFYIPLAAFIHLSIYCIAISTCYVYELPPASSLIVSCEMARISMKAHSYFMEKLLHGIMKGSDIEKFIPHWAAK